MGGCEVGLRGPESKVGNERSNFFGLGGVTSEEDAGLVGRAGLERLVADGVR